MITGLMLKKAFISGANNISNHRKDVDALNVFPVPDGDTGTNMSMTISAAVRELKVIADDEDVSVVAAKTAAALLRGARGNSGVILSLIFRGFSNGVKGLREADGTALTKAFALGTESAYKAVMKPTEGTILTVVRMAATAVAETKETDYKVVIETAYNAADKALAQTPDMLPVLKEAGVVDAGGQGLLYILEGMKSVLIDDVIIESFDKSNEKEPQKKSVVAAASADIKFGYCSEFLINKTKTPQSSPLKLKAYLQSIGDCVVVVEDDDIVKVHVHSNEPGNVIEAALKCGALTNIKIDNMRFQHQNADEGSEEKVEEKTLLERVEPVNKYGFVTVSAGEGLSSLFSELGADNVVSGGQTMNPSTDDILNAIEATPAKHVFVLPNNKNIIMAAEQTVNLADREVSVLTTKTIPQGISAMLTFDEDFTPEENHLNMMKAAESTHTAQVTFAARDSEMSGQRIKEGQILGLEDGKITLVEDDIVSAAYRVTRRLIKKYDGSLITIFYGSDADNDMAEALGKRLIDRFPNIEINIVSGGQPVYYFIVSVE
ncbi:MAG: DAK2 domain-containing protein [Oscillospiraceae bacterium]